jgi:hypothetical protein
MEQVGTEEVRSEPRKSYANDWTEHVENIQVASHAAISVSLCIPLSLPAFKYFSRYTADLDIKIDAIRQVRDPSVGQGFSLGSSNVGLIAGEIS